VRSKIATLFLKEKAPMQKKPLGDALHDDGAVGRSSVDGRPQQGLIIHKALSLDMAMSDGARLT